MAETIRQILVTGAGGFLGRHMADYLVEQGYEVTGLDLHFPDPPETMRFKAIERDFRDWETTRNLLRQSDAVYHFASAHLQISLDASEYWDVNVHSLRTLLQEAKNNGCQRFIHVSSVGAYGRLAQIPADEQTPCQPQSIYGETKLAGEGEVIRICTETDLAYVILRPAWIYGLGCPRTAKLERMLAKRRFVMIGKGDNKRHPMYIKDMVEAFHLALLRDAALGEAMIIGGDQIITTRELVETFSAILGLPGPLVTIPYPIGVAMALVAEKVFTLLGKEPPLSRRTLEFFDTDNGFDISKSKRLLGFTPRYTLRQGLENYAAVTGRR